MVCLIAQVLIRWAIQNGTSVIPKATGVSHIQGNLEALNFELSKDEFEVSCSLLCDGLCSFIRALVLSCYGALAAWICLPSAAPFSLHVCGVWLVHSCLRHFESPACFFASLHHQHSTLQNGGLL